MGVPWVEMAHFEGPREAPLWLKETMYALDILDLKETNLSNL